ncbi:oxidoreductase [Mycolicibacterium novocastrense]|uniref:hydrogen gas-evolving membrane-bound hydrogenase subunit E n=1 Tax=Mycolicibacterium novocastrense TaxID=59813 RepID=UPI00074ACA63|nr:hydrogen gas-evolving membrane-bound hydrogenase subunit E [Mycolicibacterium novocastrense]KUH65499.1 oxidoreductase [Mycolicibacterium novocastrense]KUH77324.1 oxidoreductase [Mycolicibacterium novocastrense]KUH77655.1 oxidoreductase [Mycolicibacterium novocastrense]
MAKASSSGVTGAATSPSKLPADWQGWASAALALIGFVLCLWMWLNGGGEFTVPWVPSLDLHLSFSFDGLAALYSMLACGIGALVFWYGTGYLSLHLAHEGRPARERWRFWPWMVLFAVSMVGLATAQDLVLLFVFFDITAICSYFLIGFDRSEQKARRAALMALVITVASAVAMLIAAVLLYATHGTFSIPVLLERVEPGTTTTVAAALLAVAALAKSAQVPLHFWLPKAMAAPTPVSAYLHSAAMVAAGVLVLGRVHPLLARSDAVLTGLLVVGVASIVVGGVLALGQDVLKQVLAYSTISQYGYVVMLYGIGGGAAAGAAAFYVLAHGVAKSALFMTAGAVTMATGEDRLSRLGGLGRRQPVLAAAAGIAAASLAGLPLTAGFFKDELFFDAAGAAGAVPTALAVLAAVLTLTYIGRFWMMLFLGPTRARPRAVSVALTAPVVVLAAVSVAGGLAPQLASGLAADAGSVTNAAPVHLSPAYHLDARPANLMALSVWALAAVLIATPRVRDRLARALARAGERAGSLRIYTRSLRALGRISAAIHDMEVRDLRSSVAAVLVPAGVLTALAFAVTPTAGEYAVGAVRGSDWLILPLLGLVAIATLATARIGTRVGMVLALSVVGFALAAVYALVAAPDIALVAVLVETMITLVFIAAFNRLPKRVPSSGPIDPAPPKRADRIRQWRNVIAGGVAGIAAFVSIWGFLSAPTQMSGVAEEYIRRTPSAHGEDVVTVIITDFRGLDTLGEITVLLVAVVGVATLLRRGRLW